ncbi:MAG: phosphomannose isomerase type II C-terminal cupin domain [Candidatus Omnitrophota bacterium]
MRTTRIKRPWGYYTVLNHSKGYKVKLVEVLAKRSLSLQRHSYRSEHWVVVDGKAKITNKSKIFYLGHNESTYIPIKGIHRLENVGKKTLKIIEVQCGKKLVEADIERFSDAYGRM